MTNLETNKQAAAEHALALVQSGMRLGLGTGSTARYFTEGLGARLKDGRLHDILGVPTSGQTAALAQQSGVPLTTLDEQPVLDLAVDGADEIDPQLNLVKGAGGALLREKIVAVSARQFVIIADDTKLVARLGERMPLPVEALPFGVALVARRLERLGAVAVLRRTPEGSIFETDQHNYVLDCTFANYPDPQTLDARIKAIPGVVEHGLFLGLAVQAFIAGPNGVTTMTRP